MGLRIALLTRETAILKLKGLPVPPPEGLNFAKFSVFLDGANDVGGLVSLGSLHQVKLHGLALIQ